MDPAQLLHVVLKQAGKLYYVKVSFFWKPKRNNLKFIVSYSPVQHECHSTQCHACTLMFKLAVLNCLHLTFISRVISQYYKQDKIFIFCILAIKSSWNFMLTECFITSVSGLGTNLQNYFWSDDYNFTFLLISVCWNEHLQYLLPVATWHQEGHPPFWPFRLRSGTLQTYSGVIAMHPGYYPQLEASWNV